MRLRQLFAELGRKRRFLLLMVLVATISSCAGTRGSADYTATTTLYIGSPDTGDLRSADANAVTAETLAALIDSQPTLERTIARTGVSRDTTELLRATNVVSEPGTNLLYASVTDRSPIHARLLANGLADTFVDATRSRADETVEGAREGDVPILATYVFEYATIPTEPSGFPPASRHVLAGMFGLLFGIATVATVYLLDQRATAPDAVEEHVGLRVIGAVPFDPTARSVPMPVRRRFRSGI